MVDSSTPGELLDVARRVHALVDHLARCILDSDRTSGVENEENTERVQTAWNELRPVIIEAGQLLPSASSPIADWILEVARVARWFDGELRTRSLSGLLFGVNCEGFQRVAQTGRKLLDQWPANDDPFAFVDDAEPTEGADASANDETVEQLAAPTAAASAEVTNSVAPDSSAGYLGGDALADALGIHTTRRKAFLRQLGRERLSLGDDCWHEVLDPRPNSPRFLYRVDSPKLCEIAARYKTPKTT